MEWLYEHPEGIDPPFDQSVTTCKSVPNCQKYVKVTAKKGDVFLLHGLLPHKAGANFLRYPRIIANPHVTLSTHHNLNRADANYVSSPPLSFLILISSFYLGHVLIGY